MIQAPLVLDIAKQLAGLASLSYATALLAPYAEGLGQHGADGMSDRGNAWKLSAWLDQSGEK